MTKVTAKLETLSAHNTGVPRYVIHADEKLVGFAIREKTGFRLVGTKVWCSPRLEEIDEPTTMAAIKKYVQDFCDAQTPGTWAWDKLDELAVALSPENLSCDGEMSMTGIRRARAKIMKEWKKAEKVIGRKVVLGEVEAKRMKRAGF